MEHLEQDMIEIDLREYFNVIWYRKWIIISLLVVAVLASYFISSQMTRIYKTSTMVMVKEDNGMQNLFSDQLSLGMGNNNKLATYTQILKSRRILGQVIQELDLKNEETDELIEVNALRGKINISSGADNNLITITVNYSDPIEAKNIANTLVDIFKKENREMNSLELKGADDFITEQLDEVENKLAQLENNLLEYKEEHGVVMPQEQGRVTLDKLTQLETAQAKTQVELNQSKVSLKEIEDKLAQQDKEIVSTKTITENPMIRKYKTGLADLEIKLVGLQENYTTKHPKVIEVKEKITETKTRLKETVEEIISAKTETINPIYQNLKKQLITLQTKIIALSTRLNTYQQQIRDIEVELNSLPKKELALARLQRESKVAESVYTMLREKKEEVQIQKAMKTSDIIVVDQAVVKESPIKPNTKLNIVIAAMLATFIGVGIIFLIEYLDTTIKDERDIERLTGLPVLGATPDFDMIDHSRGYGRGDE